MPITKYTKWVPSLLDGLSLEELLDQMSEFLLQSGFQYGFRDVSNPYDLEALRQAIIEKLVEMGKIPETLLQQWLDDRSEGDAQKLDELIDQIIRRLVEEGWIQAQDPAPAPFDENSQGTDDVPAGSARFELTDKSIDFLGFRLLRHLLASLGRSSFGRHETAHFATGVEAYQATKEYEFGDTLNLDISSTLLHAVAREGLGVPLNLEHEDLMVRQAEYESSCSTVLLLDTSHSMILYGEDRFTPAKRVALALSAETIGPRRCGPVSHEHVRGLAPRPAAVDGRQERHASDRHDHRRQAFRDHAAEWPDLQKCLWTGPDDFGRNVQRSGDVPESRNLNQHVHARQRSLPGGLREEGDRDLPGQSVLYDSRESRPIHLDGLSQKESANNPLNRNLTLEPRLLRQIKRAPQIAGLLSSWRPYFFFLVAFFFAGAFFVLAMDLFTSDPFLSLRLLLTSSG